MQFEKNISYKRGLLPGTPVYIGDTPPHETRISTIIYSESDLIHKEGIKSEDILSFIKSGYFTWIRVEGLLNTDIIESIFKIFSIHPLIIEDIFNTEGRAKIEEFPDYLFIILNRFYTNQNSVATEQISFILTKSLLITCSETINPFYPVQERLIHSIDKLRERKVDYLTYTIIDTIVDDYFSILENLEEQIEELEDVIITDPQSDTIRSIQFLRHDIRWFRRHIWATREIITRLERIDSPYIEKNLHIFIKDLYDHMIKISEDIDIFREMTEGLMEIYLSNISNYSNQIIKMLTIIATIFIPLTFISSIYGMNFDNMPELHNPIGYPVALSLMISVAAIMLLYFRKKGWL